MLVPSTPTSASGAFWKGSELGSDPPAQPAAPSTTSEVVKSKLTSHPAAGVALLPPDAQLKTPLPWDERALAPNLGLGKEQAWQEGGRKEHAGGPDTWARGGRPPLTQCPTWPCSPRTLVGVEAD